MEETFYRYDIPSSLAFLSDTHNTDPAPILRSLRKNRPDVIVITGDFVRGERSAGGPDKMEESHNAMELFRECSRISPTFVSMGNHERSLVPHDLEMIADTGVTILENTWIPYNGFCIGGLSSAYFSEYKNLRSPGSSTVIRKERVPYYLRKAPEPDTSWLGEFCRSEGKKILLCHHPEYYDRFLRHFDLDLVLSGHCHGGQWRYYSLLQKRWRGLYAPGQGLFPSLTSGIHDGRLVISRGLSNTAPVPRVNNPTEVIYFNIGPGGCPRAVPESAAL